MTQALVNPNSMKAAAQPWLASPRWDCLLIIAPAFITSAIALLFRAQLDNSQFMPLWAWVCFVLVVDVAHVYATLFRTYFDRKSFHKHRALLVLIPIACWLVGYILYRMDDLIFWRALAYLAVFHFIRQQYGFTALYARKEPAEFGRFRWLDQLTVYTVTLYPILYWHTHLPRSFHWFIEGDFVRSLPLYLNEIGLTVYWIVIGSYIAKEIYLSRKTAYFNLPKNLIVSGTALSWFVGIVALNSDLAFTMTNVVSHGVPYMALIWLYHRKQASATAVDTMRTKRDYGIMVRDLIMTFAPAFVLFLVLLAYLEEGFWDGLIWREHLTLFAPFSDLPAVSDAATLAMLVPFLSLPQSTHYVLDGFIWRVKDKTSHWSANR